MSNSEDQQESADAYLARLLVDPRDKEELFTADEVANAIHSYLLLGERHHAGGYFSAGGWAARCLRFHFKQHREYEKTRLALEQLVNEFKRVTAKEPKV